MYEKLNEQIRAAQEGIARKQRLENAIETLKREKAPIERKANALYKKLCEENLDVEKLEKMSFRKMVYSLINQLVERTEKEKREALAAKLKYDLANKDLEDIKKKVLVRKKELVQYQKSEEDYKRLFNKKKELLMHQPTEKAQSLLEKSKRLNELVITEKNAKEALSFGKLLLETLDGAWFFLGKARSWKRRESRRSIIVKVIKESYLKSLQDSLWSARRQQRSFNEELSALGLNYFIDISTVDFDPDPFYDSMFMSDTHSAQVNSAESSIVHAKHEVSQALSKVQTIYIDASKEAAELKTYLDNVVLYGVSETK